MKQTGTKGMALGLVAVLALAGCSGSELSMGAKDDAAGIVEVATEFVPGVVDRAELLHEQLNLQRWLASERISVASQAPISIEVSAEKLRKIALQEMDERTGPAPVLIGITQPVRATIDFSDLRPEVLTSQPVVRQFGAIRKSGDQGFVWSAPVRSEGAKALRIHFADVALPRGARLYVYNDAGQAFGPYTGKGPQGSGEFWSPSLRGAEAYVQIRLAGQTKNVLAATWLVIDQIAHVDAAAVRRAQTGVEEKSTPEGHCGGTAWCVVDATCVDNGDWSYIDEARLGVAYYEFIQRPYIYMCSGGLVADTDAGSEVPYLLTANHCLDRDRIAGTVEAFFQYWTESCQGACVEPTGGVAGAAVIRTNKTGDYTLLRLNGAPPGDSVYFGWTTEPVAFSSGTHLYRVSHPAGAPQAYSRHVVDVDKPTCSSWPRGSWIYSHDVIGATQGGSSGSPVLNQAGQVVGQLSGGCGSDVYNDCNADANATVDGAFAAYFAEVADVLDPAGGSCPDGDGDGFADEACGGNDCDDGNDQINPGATEVCGDGVDNNCDGSVDEGCGGSCLPSGESCTQDSDCCGGRCKKGVCRG